MSIYDIPEKLRWENQYSYAFKMQVIEAVENGKLSQNQAAKHFGVHRKSIARWLSKYGNFDKKLKEMGGKSPKQEIADLRAKLRVSESENKVLKAVVDIIEQEYGEDILKKYVPESLTKKIVQRRKK